MQLFQFYHSEQFGHDETSSKVLIAEEPRANVKEEVAQLREEIGQLILVVAFLVLLLVEVYTHLCDSGDCCQEEKSWDCDQRSGESFPVEQYH